MLFLVIYFLCYIFIDCKLNFNVMIFIKDIIMLLNGWKIFFWVKIKLIKIIFGIVIGKYWLIKLILLYI